MRKHNISTEERKHIVSQLLRGVTIKSIVTTYEKRGEFVCRQTIWRWLKHYIANGSWSPLPRSGRPTKLIREALDFIESTMQSDDETTAQELVVKLRGLGCSLSKRTVLKGRKELGWTQRGAAYYQLIRDVNKQKRLEWALAHRNDDFHNVIWTDETTVQMESHRRFCCRKKGQKPRYKPRPKHPTKVHVWAGISWSGSTKVCVFDGIMNAEFYVDILSRCLVPFCQQVYPNGHRFMQDNDPKHTSRRAKSFFEDNGINWWRTPPESPDANPIENLWHELKVQYIYH